ncbi:hypothetical protein, partial [Aliivibrio sp.]|uniref:hypothetical protein n=1 Tax=Aliivibrio sp. TaxID=1872443 RepID=UPI003D2F486E
ILHEKGKINRDESSLAPVSFQIQHREWSGQYRGQLVTQTPSSSAPAANVGERFTKKLSKRSVSKIFESAAYTATCHGGFTTFLTATFDKTQRRGIFGGMDTGCEENDIGAHHPIGYKRNMVTYRSSPSVLRTESPVCNVAGPYTDIELDGHRRVMNLDREIVGDYCLLSQKPEKPFTMTKTLETTIGKEVSRLLDGMKKMYHRGWLADHTIQTDEESGAKYCDLNVEPVPGHKKNVTIDDVEMQAPADFHYIWVAECPANEEGEPNPHVHILLKWTVEPHLFSAWAKRCEKIWGHGFAKLERIREPKAAGTYIIKAVGYAAKGENADQGLIKGNRYNIAKCSRAPAWECIASFEAGNITAIIKELGYKLEQWKKPHKRKLNRLIKEKTQTIKAAGIAKDQNKPADALNKLQSRIIRLEKQAQKVQKDMKSKGVHASSENRFSISFDGDDAETKVDRFLSWAAGARGWSMDCRDGDLSEIKNNADVAYKTQYQQHLERRSYWASVFNDDAPMPEVDSLEIDYYQSLRSEYELSCSQVMQI